LHGLKKCFLLRGIIMAKEIKSLIKGYKKFKQHYFEKQNPLFNELANGQKPDTLVIGCSDSRVDQAIVTNCQPGELFVIRNVANLVPPYEEDNAYHGTSAGLEFAVRTLGVKHIIVFGHAQCGGIMSLFQKSEQSSVTKSFVSKWMELAQPAYDAVRKQGNGLPLEEQITLCCQNSIVNSLRNLRTFPWIRHAEQKGDLQLHGWYFDLLTGVIKSFDTDKNAFVELE
jgi:carbonic anhydrase